VAECRRSRKSPPARKWRPSRGADVVGGDLHGGDWIADAAGGVEPAFDRQAGRLRFTTAMLAANLFITNSRAFAALAFAAAGSFAIASTAGMSFLT
jgi:hypothetical protein